MLSCLDSATLCGIDSVLVRVEIDIVPGLPNYTMVGLPDASAAESKERVRGALRNSGYGVPNRRITVNLAPGEVRKEGPRFDLAIALAILAADEEDRRLHPRRLRNLLVLGELALDGSVRPVRGVLSSAMAARAAGIGRVLVPRGNGAEAALVPGLEVLPVASLHEAIEVCMGRQEAGPVPPPPAPGPDPGLDLSCVRGQAQARRALEIAAAGGHHLLLMGPPGAGKTLLARCLPSILPPLAEPEALEVTRIHSAWKHTAVRGLVGRRPFRAPSCSISLAGLTGSFQPGEVSLAHRGVLFLDEFPEFRRDCLESLRSPLEEGQLLTARAGFHATYPCRFTLVAAMNPCPCGFFGDPARECACTPAQRHRYLHRISGPLLDRIDLQVQVTRPRTEELLELGPGESSAEVRERVLRARRAQEERGALNSELGPEETRRHCALDAGSRRFLGEVVRRLALSARAHDRALRLARTLADLEGQPGIGLEHVAEAVGFRALEREAA